jgi:prevent-host-death family protein
MALCQWKRQSASTKLKGKLSEYPRAARKGGELAIKDRETPIARLVPYAESRPRLEEALREERRDRF